MLFGMWVIELPLIPPRQERDATCSSHSHAALREAAVLNAEGWDAARRDA
jgi:hypothetical protein